MQYCKNCVQPDTRPGIVFKDGLCGACLYDRKENSATDWKVIENELQEIVDYARKNANGGYECVVGVSGGKDSTFQALYAKEQLGLNVLLANCVPDSITETGRHNIENLINHGFDCHHVRPNPKVMRALTRRSFYEYGNPVKASEYPLYAIVFQVALAFKIPLIILGENPGLTLGVSKGLGAGGDAMNVNLENTLAGGNASDWIEEGIGFKDLIPYQFPDKKKLADAGVKAIYLGYYVKDFSPDHNIDFSISRGLQGIDIPPWLQELIGRPRLYSSIDSEMQQINKVLKYYKMGFSDVTTTCSRLIREGKMTRARALEIVEQYDGYCEPKYIEGFCNYLDIGQDEFWRVVERWTNRNLFFKDASGKWLPKFKVGTGIVE